MKQQLQFQERIDHLDKINNNINNVRRKISEKKYDNEENYREYQKVAKNLFQTKKDAYTSSTIKEKNLNTERVGLDNQFYKVEQSSKPQNSKMIPYPINRVGCIVQSKNGIMIKAKKIQQSHINKQKQVVCESKDLHSPPPQILSSYRDEFQTVRSINLGQHIQTSTKDNQDEIISHKQSIILEKKQQLNQQIEQINLKINSSQIKVIHNDDEQQNYELIQQKQRLEEEIFKLDSQIKNNKLQQNALSVKQTQKKRLNWKEDKENFEFLWNQLEMQEGSHDLIKYLSGTQEEDQQIHHQCLYKEQQSIEQNNISRSVIDTLAQEVEELMMMNHISPEQDKQFYIYQSFKSTYYLSQQKCYIPPLSVIEEEPSMEVSFLQ